LDELGRPFAAESSASVTAWPHLTSLLLKCHAHVASMAAPPRPPPSEDNLFSPKRPSIAPSTSPVTLIGFSKGTVVLNQLLLELPILQSSPRSKTIESIESMIQRVCCVHFLDGIGHTRLVPHSYLPPSAFDSRVSAPPSVSPLSSSFLSASHVPSGLDSVSETPWYNTLPIVTTPIPSASFDSVPLRASPTASVTLSLPLLPHRCVFMIHGTPYQWSEHDPERAVRKPQALWLHSQLEDLGFSSHILVTVCTIHNLPFGADDRALCACAQEYYKGEERDKESIVKHHFKLLFDFKLHPDPA
jgi:Uncharacterised protein family UPF0565